MKKQWRIRDLIDLEYFLHDDESIPNESPAEDPNQQERDIYLNHIEPHLSKQKNRKTQDRNLIIRLWLEKKKDAQKAKSNEAFLPGDIFHMTYRFMVLFFLVCGLMTGFGTAFSFLIYKGTAPINVSAFFGLFVLLQIFLVIIVCVFMLLQNQTHLLKQPSLGQRLFGSLLVKLFVKIRESTFSNLPARERNRTLAALGIAKGKHRQYGAIIYWPVFILTQVFATTFNIGILLATILKVVGSDLAFGWQSTLQFSAQSVHKWLSFISLPWSWFIPGEFVHPTLEQIEGSRMILKDGIYQLSTTGLVSWWPFLCFSVVCYGFLPRFILLLFGIIKKNRSLSKIDFYNTTYDRLIFRLTTPVISAGGTPIDSNQNQRVPFETISPGPPWETEPSGALTKNRVIALIPDDIDASCPEKELRDRIAHATGLFLIKKISCDFTQIKSEKVVETLITSDWEQENQNVLLLQEAWQPPIRETILFINLLRSTLEKNTTIRIGLIGKPKPDTIFTFPNQENVRIWKQAITAIGDPGICIEILGGNNER